MVLTFHLTREVLNLQFVYCFIIKLYPVPKGLIQSNFCEKTSILPWNPTSRFVVWNSNFELKYKWYVKEYYNYLTTKTISISYWGIIELTIKPNQYCTGPFAQTSPFVMFTP